ncbi:IS30 family transposase [Vibrio breoganii]
MSSVLTRPGARVSQEWIYSSIARGKRQGGKLFRHLRQGHKRHRRGKTKGVPVIKNAISMNERPEIVDNLERIGAGEIDTVLSKHGIGAMLTILERKTRYYLTKKATSKSAKDVTKATIDMLLPSYKEFFHTATADNRCGFVGHQEIAKTLEANVCFAHPYSSWQRGANESANGLLRQYVRKETDLRIASDDNVERAHNGIIFVRKSV